MSKMSFHKSQREKRKKSKCPTIIFISFYFFKKKIVRYGPVIIKSLIFGLELAIYFATGQQRVALPQGGKDLEKLNLYLFYKVFYLMQN